MELFSRRLRSICWHIKLTYYLYIMEKHKICQSKHGTDSRITALDLSVEPVIIAATFQRVFSVAWTQ